MAGDSQLPSGFGFPILVDIYGLYTSCLSLLRSPHSRQRSSPYGEVVLLESGHVLPGH